MTHVTLDKPTAKKLKDLKTLKHFYQHNNPAIIKAMIDKEHAKAVKQGKISE